MCFFFFLNFFPLSIVLITHTWNWPCVLWFSFHLTLLVLLSHCFTPVQHETHFQQHFSISVSLSLACFYLSLSLSLVLQRTRAKANTLSDNNEKHWYRWDEEMLLFFFPTADVVHGANARLRHTTSTRKCWMLRFYFELTVLLHTLSLITLYQFETVWSVLCILLFSFLFCHNSVIDSHNFFFVGEFRISRAIIHY